jgi:hypothetical protein
MGCPAMLALAEMPVSHDLRQKKLNQSLNGLKNSTCFSHPGATFKDSHRLSH